MEDAMKNIFVTTMFLFLGANTLACSANHGDGNPGTSQAALSPADNRLFVSAVYIMYLHRLADYGGLEFWAGRMDGGESPLAVAQEIVQSTEGLGALAQIEGSVSTEYSILGRYPDPSASYWNGPFSNPSEGPEYVAEQLLASDEFVYKVAPSIATCAGVHARASDCFQSPHQYQLAPGTCAALIEIDALSCQ
jgi:hypothetical protein